MVAPALGPEYDPESGEETIKSCVRRQDLEGVRRHVEERGADPNTKDENNISLLHWAALGKDASTIMYLLERGADPNARNMREETPLHWAAQVDLGVVHVLVVRGADARAVDNKGYSPMHHAAQKNQPLVMDYLHAKGLPVDVVDNDGRTPLHWAAYMDHPVVVQWLLSHGADITAQDREQCMPLHWAALKGSAKAANELVVYGTQVSRQLEARDMTNSTAAELAAEKVEKATDRRIARGASRTRHLITRRQNLLRVLKPLGLDRYIPPHHYFMFWVLALVVMPAGMWTYYTYMLEYTAHRTELTMVFYLSYLLQWAFWAHAGFADPGTLAGGPAGRRRHPRYDELHQAYEADLMNGRSDNLCPSTRIKKPERSKYDAVSRRCIERFDHFCPWMNNAVGRNNYRSFFGFLVTAFVTATAFNILYYDYVFAVGPSRTSAFFNYLAFPGMSLFVLHFMFYSLFAFLLIIQHGHLISRNLTTNEAINWQKYPYLTDRYGRYVNKYDRGVWNNWLEFLGLGMQDEPRGGHFAV